MLVVFVALIAVPAWLGAAPDSAGPLDHWSALADYLIWAVWFPLVFLSVVATGRSWCGLMCPMGAASEWANRLGPRWAIPRWLASPATPLVSFLIITIWGQTLGVRDHPEAAAILFGSVMAAAIALGFIFGRSKRAWCRHACPIGLLLGVYSRLGAVDFRPKVPAAVGPAYSEHGPCPTMIGLPVKNESRHCIECFRCVNPESRGGLTLALRAPGAEVANISHHHPNLAEVLFLFIGTGAALGGFLWLVLGSYQDLRRAIGEWAIERGWLWVGEPGPIWLMANYPAEREVFRWLDLFLISGYMLGWVAAITALLSATTALAAWLAGLSGAGARFRQRFVALGYQYAPVAMVSLVIGLGGDLFNHLAFVGLTHHAIGLVKAAFFALGLAWSLYLGFQLLADQGVPRARRWLALLPGAIGSLAIGWAWSPALF